MAGESDYKLEYKRYRQVKGGKSKTRNTAYKLSYLVLLSNSKNKTRDSAKIFDPAARFQV